MSSLAIVVGIDAYPTKPLSTAVLDARRVSDTLTKLSLVDEVVLLVSDATDPKQLPTRKNVLASFKSIRSAANPPDRLLFYFSGHGILCYRDAARNLTRTALATIDVADFEEDGAEYIDFNALIDSFETCGPEEQIFVVDACRNLAWKKHPSVSSDLGFSETPQGAARRQAVFYAVSQLGEAIGDVGEGGRFTTHLLEGLQGKGKALAHDASSDEYVITPHSLREHLEHRMKSQLDAVPLWRRKYQLPQSPRSFPDPIRSVGSVTDVPFAVHIEPDGAAPLTAVGLKCGGHILVGKGWPPTTNHGMVLLPPMVHQLFAESSAGQAVPAKQAIDPRCESEATIRIGKPADLEPMPPGVSPSAAAESATTGEPKPHATIVATAAEPTTRIVVTGTEPPHASAAGYGSLTEELPAGPYRVEFLNGDAVYSTATVLVAPGETSKVEARMERLATFGTSARSRDATPKDYAISESIGLMQAGFLETTLALIGLKPFDADGVVAARLNQYAPWHVFAPEHDEFEPVISVVVALESDGWPASPEQLLSETVCSIARSGHEDALQATLIQPFGAGPDGLDGRRIGLATFPALPGMSHGRLTIFQSDVLNVALSVAAVVAHVTVVTIVARPDGSLNIEQYVVPKPKSGELIVGEELYRTRRIGPRVRALHLTQRLLRETDSIPDLPNAPQLVREILALDVIDPLLSAELLMRGHPAWRRVFDFDSLVSDRFSGDGSFGPRALADASLAWRLVGDRGRRFRHLPTHDIPVLGSVARRIAASRDLMGERGPILRALQRARPGSLWMEEPDPVVLETEVPPPVGGTESGEGEGEVFLTV